MTLGVSVATLTRPFGATSPIEGEVMCALPPLHLSPCGRGRAQMSPGEGETPRYLIEDNAESLHAF
jgi:hypothetical protein